MNDKLLEALERGRDDYEFFAHFMLGEKLHPGEVEWLENSNAQINVLTTGNRWGKSHTMGVKGHHNCIYKIGAEWRYINEYGEIDPALFEDTKYDILNTAQGWDTVALVWQRAWQLCDRPVLKQFIQARPKSIPPHITYINGARWNFKTTGAQGQGLDGASYYLIQVDEAGWIDNLADIIGNVGRIRTADVQGRIDLVGTMKSGISRDFYQYSVQAANHTGANINFDFDSWQRKRQAEAA